MSSLPLLAYFGHHRCASSWVKGILTDICSELALAVHTYSGRRGEEHLLSELTANGIGCAFCTNANRSQAAILPPFRGFHVVRDPRDVVVSSYFSHRNSHRLGGWLTQEYRDQLTQLDEEDGILLEMKQRGNQFRSMGGWDYHNPAVLELRMEDMIADPLAKFSKVAEFLGILAREESNPTSLTTSRLAAILSKHSFEAKTGGRQPGQENPHAHYRKGVHGDWANYFRPVHIRYFKEHYNDLLLKLGYEQQADW